MNEERSRYVCAPCSKRLRAKVICDVSVCPRCTTICKLEPVGYREPRPRNVLLIEKVLAQAAASGRFRLTRKEQTS